MKRKWVDPPNWDSHLDEAIEEVNALAPAAIDIAACRAWPEPPEVRRGDIPLPLAVALMTMGAWLIGACAWVLGVAP